MNDAQNQPEVMTEAQAMEAAQAGYDKSTRGEEKPPVVVEPSTKAETVDETPETIEEPVVESAPEDAVAEQLKAIKAQVQTMAETGVDRETVRKMHGEIGNINRTLQQLQALKKEAPASDELAAALESAEQVATEFPEIAGPLVKAMKALQAQAKAEPTPTTEESPPVDAERLRQEIAIAAIDEVHPDRMQIRKSPEFIQWLAAKTPEYQTQVNTTWNPAVLSQCFTDFKATLTARKRKQERLDAAATPQGVPTQGQSNILPDEAGYARGYAKARRL